MLLTVLSNRQRTSGQHGGAVGRCEQQGLLVRIFRHGGHLAGGVALADRLALGARSGVGSGRLRGSCAGDHRERAAGQCAQQDAAALDIAVGGSRRRCSRAAAAAAVAA